MNRPINCAEDGKGHVGDVKGEVSDLGSQVTRRAIAGPLAGILAASYQEPPSPPTNV